MPTTMQEDKTPKLKTSRQRRTKQASPDIVAVEFVSLDTQIKIPLWPNREKRERGARSLEMPSKPNRKTRLTNQLRLNSKALFDPSLKEKNPIVIEDQDTEEDLSEFSNMEEMDIHTLKGMTRDKTRKKCSEGETSGVKYVVVKNSTLLIHNQNKMWWTLVQTLSKILMT
jgi:hypothetical protein